VIKEDSYSSAVNESKEKDSHTEQSLAPENLAEKEGSILDENSVLPVVETTIIT
jgi:hypothetical protein|tara:strand:- start:334 stop:495 length:162 start_codon:yes stop_codon:yes gene_type:complete